MEINKKIFILIVIFFPFLAFANTEQDLTYYDYGYEDLNGALNLAADHMSAFWGYFETELPDFITRLVAYIVEQVTILNIIFKIESIKLAWSVAEKIMENYDIATRLASQLDALPQDMKAVLIDTRLLDGINYIIQAGIARFTMRYF